MGSSRLGNMFVSHNLVSYNFVSYNFVTIFTINKNINSMEAPFTYGKLAVDKAFTDREDETRYLKNNYLSNINTILISPRRWGKSSLVNHVAKQLKMIRT